MTPEEIKSWLAQTFDDRRFSRGERQELAPILMNPRQEVDREAIRRQAFAFAAGVFSQPQDQDVLTWLEDVVKALRDPALVVADQSLAEAYFSPGDECQSAIKRLLNQARKSVDICVFTITDDRIAQTIVETHQRGVAVRIITDNEKAEDLGSDVDRFESAGIPLRVDRSSYHMHHKFAIFDAKILSNGSYNWTRGAANDNEENLMIVNEPRLIQSFTRAFDRLWLKLA